MRRTQRILAVVSLATFGLALTLFISSYLKNPCPLGFLFKLSLVVFGTLGMTPALFGCILAARFAGGRRQWVWLAGLLAVPAVGLAFLFGAALDVPPPVVQAPITALSHVSDRAFGLASCGTGSSLFVQAAVIMLALALSPLVLLIYSVSAASRAATGAGGVRRDG